MTVKAKEDTRFPRFSGSFYPEGLQDLESLLEQCRSRARPVERQDIRGIVVPHAGFIYSGSVAVSGYLTMAAAEKGTTDTLLLVGPNHRGFPPFSVMDDHAYWSVPNGRIALITDVIGGLSSSTGLIIDRKAHQIEHSLEVQIPMILAFTEARSIVPIIMGDQEAESVLQLYDSVKGLFGEMTVVISSDLTHYMPDSVARKIDREIIDRIVHLDIEGLYSIIHEGATPCGYGPIALLMTFAKENGCAIEKIDYGTSADATGDLSSVVGYSSLVCYEKN